MKNKIIEDKELSKEFIKIYEEELDIEDKDGFEDKFNLSTFLFQAHVS